MHSRTAVNKSLWSQREIDICWLHYAEVKLQECIKILCKEGWRHYKNAWASWALIFDSISFSCIWHILMEEARVDINTNWRTTKASANCQEDSRLAGSTQSHLIYRLFEAISWSKKNQGKFFFSVYFIVRERRNWQLLATNNNSTPTKDG